MRMNAPRSFLVRIKTGGGCWRLFVGVKGMMGEFALSWAKS